VELKYARSFIRRIAAALGWRPEAVTSIRGTVNSGILEKADRLFRNDDHGIWIEILQNARRAGATEVEVSINDERPNINHCRIAVQDNGRGIDDFGGLVTLGASDWSVEISEREDPAGMGFFSLCRSEVVVPTSNN
jgi:Histidine kinase-, DNA gyrase B-, and HSP90-like ATPase